MWTLTLAEESTKNYNVSLLTIPSSADLLGGYYYLSWENSLNIPLTHSLFPGNFECDEDDNNKFLSCFSAADDEWIH